MSTSTLVAAADGMSTYSLSGSGVQLLTADTTALHVSITTLSPFGGIGNANPANHYHQALIRPGDGTGYWAPIPVEGGPQWIGLPNGTDRIGYACEGGAVISVVEVIGGTSPFAGPPGSPGGALTYHEDALGADVVMTNSATDYDVLTRSLAAGTWLLLAEVEAYNASVTTPHIITAKLWDGSTVYKLASANEFNNAAIGTICMFVIVVIPTTTTVKLTCQDLNVGGTHIGAANLGAPFSAADTHLVAIQIA